MEDQSHVAARSRSSVSGPSFLGLGDDDDSPSYLLEEETTARPSHMRRNIVVFAVLLVGVLGFLEWRANRPGATSAGPMEMLHLKLPKKNAGAAEQHPTPAANQADDSSTPQLVAEPVQPSVQVTPSPTAEPTEMAAAPTPVASPLPTIAPSPEQNGSTESSPEEPVEGESTAVETARNTPPSEQARRSMPQSESVEEEPAPERPARNTVRDDTARAGQVELQQGVAAGATEAGRMWLWKATAKGNPTAPVLLAQMYLDGNGVARNCEQAILLLQTASRKNNPRARSKLGNLYATGQCVPQDRVQAYRWMSAALEANPGSEWLDQNRETLWNQMTPGERQRAKPFR